MRYCSAFLRLTDISWNLVFSVSSCIRAEVAKNLMVYLYRSRKKHQFIRSQLEYEVPDIAIFKLLASWWYNYLQIFNKEQLNIFLLLKYLLELGGLFSF